MNLHFLIHVSFVQNTMIYRNIKFNLPSLDRMKQIYISKFMYLMFNIISENMDVMANVWILARYFYRFQSVYLYGKDILQSAYVIQAKLHEVELYI